ncbi:MAG: phosphoglycerate kinase [Candidatus Woesearchaeota archaeon]
MANPYSLSIAQVKNKRVLVRVDYNVPITPDGKISDMTRIVKTLPTIKYLLQQQAKVTLCAHLGRPKGKDLSQSLQPIAQALRNLGYQVVFVPDCIGKLVEESLERQQDNEVIMLENLRFYDGEEKNDPQFAQQLIAPFDLFVNDGFGVCHRDAASVSGVVAYKPSYFGFLLEQEIEKLSSVLNPQKPAMVVLGGAKISTKLQLIKQLLPKVDGVLLGGAMIFTFYKAMGLNVGKSPVEEAMLGEAKALLSNPKLYLPVDIVVAKEKTQQAPTSIVQPDQIQNDEYGLDLGPKTIALYRTLLSPAKTIFWNGPLGLFEIPQFATGTMAIAQYLATLQANVVVGGGESVAAITQAGLEERFYHVSTGGGASLEFLEGKALPGIAAILKQG